MDFIKSFTLNELRDARDGAFLKHDARTAALSEPTVLYAYANTIVLEVKSSHYSDNGIKYKVFVLFEDFYTIGRDKDIGFDDAVDYALNYGDVHVRCTCPAMLYWGYSYIGTELKYLYGVPREGRFPKERNPNLKGTMCKHADKVVQWLLSHKDIVKKLFAAYYGRLDDGQSIYAVNTQGTTVTIGKKNEEGDVFFERLAEEPEEEAEEEIQEEETQEETTDEDPLDAFEGDFMEEEDNVEESE